MITTLATLTVEESGRPKGGSSEAPSGGSNPVAPLAPADYLTVLDAVTTAAIEDIAGASAALLLERATPNRFGVVATAGSPPLHLDEVATFGDDEIIRDGVAERLPVRRAGQVIAGSAKKKQAAGVLAVPITLCGRRLGEIVVFGAPAAGNERLVARLEELAASAAPAAAVGRADSFDMHLTELGAVVEVGQVLTGLLDMEDVLSYVVYLAESLVGGNCASVALLSDDGSHVIIGNSTGSLRGHEGTSVSAEHGILGRVVSRGEPVITPSLSEETGGFDFGAGLGPAVAVPITTVGKVIGAFLVARLADARPFPGESAGVLQQMAAYAAIAITNSRTHRNQQEIAETLRKQAAELERAYDELNRSQDQLLISEKMAALGRITAGIAHEINSPLSGIMNALMAVRGFISEYETSIDDPEITGDDHRAIAGDMKSALSTAEGALAKVAQFVKSIKSQTRSGESRSTVFDPAVEVDATIVLLRHELKRRRVGVFTEMERGHRLSGDQGKFAVVVQNLVTNAVDAYQGEAGEIWIRLAKKDDRLVLKVEDHGSGIPEEIRARIFDYLFTTKDVGKGTGLGLAMVHSVVTTNFRGEIALESEVGRGSTFIISVPLIEEGETSHGA